MVVTPGGVDLRSGVYKWNKTVLSIGAEQVGGIDFRRITRTYGRGELPGKLGQFNHNWDIRFRRITRASSGSGGVGFDVVVTSDELSYTFLDLGSAGSLALTSNTAYATMTRTNVGSAFYYTLTTADGTVVVSRSDFPAGVSYASSVTYANGVTYTLGYDLGTSVAARLRNVVSNAGYALVLEYTSGSSYLVSKACVLNLSFAALPATNICPAGASTASYAYAGQLLSSETDPTGAVWGFTSNYVNLLTPFTETYKLPGTATPYLTLTYDYAESFQLAIVRQLYADGRDYSYSWSVYTTGDGSSLSLVPVGYVEDAGPTTVSVDVYRYNVVSPPRVAPGLSSITDGLGRTTTFDWCLQTCAYALLRSKTLPEGIKAAYIYDSFHNLTKTTITPKPGSSLAAIVTSSAFDCTNIVNCNKPTATVDGRNSQTDYTYDGTHGGVLTETKPGGVRPQTRYTYTQRYAWISNGAGGYQASGPIWLRATESFCRTSAASGSGCALAGDEVVTTYDYGPNSGPNTLLLRGKVVTADGVSLRTCYGYDALGRKISETSANAGLGSCS